MKRYTFYIDEKVLALLKERQQKTGVLVAEQIRRALAEHLEREKKRDKRR